MGGEAEQLVVSQSRTVGSGSVITFDDLVGCVASNQLWHTQFLPASRTTLRLFDGCSAQAASEALNALYKANALEGCEPVVFFSIDNEADFMRKGALEAMMVDGYVHKTADTGNTSSWQVTEAGQKHEDLEEEFSTSSELAQFRVSHDPIFQFRVPPKATQGSYTKKSLRIPDLRSLEAQLRTRSYWRQTSHRAKTVRARKKEEGRR